MNYRESKGYGSLREVIEENSQGRAFDYYPSPGNWGDALINEGTSLFFSEHRFRYHSRRRTELPENPPKKTISRLAIVGGGGGWCRNWSSTASFVDSVSSVYQNVVLLPTTFDSKVRDLDLPNVTYFSRDTAVQGEQVIFCHDMAFYREYPEPSTSVLDYPLLAFRRDKERHPDSATVDRNFDLSLLGDSWTPTSGMIDILSRFQAVYTDRLHLGIASAMLGLKVYFLDGNYPKNRRLFECSLRPFLANIEMLSWNDFKNRNPTGVSPIGEPGY